MFYEVDPGYREEDILDEMEKRLATIETTDAPGTQDARDGGRCRKVVHGWIAIILIPIIFYATLLFYLIFTSLI